MKLYQLVVELGWRLYWHFGFWHAMKNTSTRIEKHEFITKPSIKQINWVTIHRLKKIHSHQNAFSCYKHPPKMKNRKKIAINVTTQRLFTKYEWIQDCLAPNRRTQTLYMIHERKSHRIIVLISQSSSAHLVVGRLVPKSWTNKTIFRNVLRMKMADCFE